MVLAAAALALAACAGPGGGEGRTNGVIDATATAPLPAGQAIRVVAEDARADAAMGQAIARGLRERGAVVADDGVLVLAHRLSFGPGDPPPRPEVAVGGVLGSSGTRDVGIGIGLPIMGLFQPRATRFTVSATLKQAEAVLWQGWITGATREEDAPAAARAAATLLLSYLGDTVRGQRFSLP